MEKHTVVAVDVAKDVFQVAVSEAPGRVARERRLKRSELLAFFAQHPKATVVMKACSSAHYWGRELGQLGHESVLLPPHQVRPYVTRNKTDRSDAKGADVRVPVRLEEESRYSLLDGTPHHECLAHHDSNSRRDGTDQKGRYSFQPRHSENAT